MGDEMWSKGLRGIFVLWEKQSVGFANEQNEDYTKDLPTDRAQLSDPRPLHITVLTSATYLNRSLQVTLLI